MDSVFGRVENISVQETASAGSAVLSRWSPNFQEHIKVDADKIARFCFAQRSAVSEDLANLSGVIWWVDRAITRHRTKSWSRNLSVRVPVFELELFRSLHVKRSLEEALRYLTGDTWEFEFCARSGQPLIQERLALAGVPFKIAMPYSDGLDSFAHKSIMSHSIGEDAILCVRAETRNRARAQIGSRILGVPISIYRARREMTYRTRPFGFFVFSALAAAAAESTEVHIAENGQGSVAVALLPFGNEWPFRSTHPGFIRRLQVFLDAVLPRKVILKQPNLWSTKGEVLSRMKSLGREEGWHVSSSCSNNHRYEYGFGIGCGICGGCVLRHVSAIAADLDLTAEKIALHDFGSAELTISNDGEPKRPLNDGELDILAHTVRSMAEFPQIVLDPANRTRLLAECYEIDPTDPLAAYRKLEKLARRHKDEWDRFISLTDEGAMMRELAEAA